VLSPLLYSLFTHDCVAKHNSNTIIKFVDDSTVVGLIKTKEVIVDYRKSRAKHFPILTDEAVVEQVESFKFLGVHITNKLSWSKHSKNVVNRAHQECCEQSPLRKLKRFGVGPQILKKFHRCTVESILTSCITAWYGNCLASDRKALQRGVRTAQYITGAKLPAIQDLQYILGGVRGRPKNCQRLQSPKP
jgi:hypothetical protein